MARSEKVASAIQKEVSSIIHDELKDPRLGFVTITRVELTGDLRFAKIFFSVLGGDQERAKTQEALNSAMGFIRRLLAERVQLRFAPEIIFKTDKSSEYSIRIQQIIDEVNKNNEPKKSNKPPKRKK
jgi:ribosome-binding factor A